MVATTELVDHIQSKGALGSLGSVDGTSMRVGNVASVVEPGKVMITLGGDTQAVPARHLGSYTPVVDDTVLVLIQEPDLVVMGSTTRGQDVSDQIPEYEERDFTENPIQEFELGQESIVAHHVKDARLGELSLALDTLRNEVLTDDVIEEVHISDDTITAPMLKANIITGDHINGRQITGEHIVGDSVTANEIATETIAADTAFLETLKVDKGMITSLNANVIDAGYISADRISSGTISAGTVNINTTLDMLSSGIISAADGRIRIKGDEGIRFWAEDLPISGARNELSWYTTETGSTKIGGLVGYNMGTSDKPMLLYSQYERIIIRASNTSNTFTGGVYIGEPSGNPGSNLFVMGSLYVGGSVSGISASDVGAASSDHGHVGVYADFTHTHSPLSAGDGLSGTTYYGNNGRTFSVDSSVVRTSGNQTISGTKYFSGTLYVTGNLSGVSASDVGAAPSTHYHSYASTSHGHSSDYIGRSTGTWHSDSGGQQRFYYSGSSMYMRGSPIAFRNAGNATIMSIEGTGDVNIVNGSNLDVTGTKNARIADPEDSNTAYRFAAVEFDNPGTLGTIIHDVEMPNNRELTIPIPEYFSRIGESPTVLVSYASEPETGSQQSPFGYVTGWDEGTPEIVVRGPRGTYNVLLLFIRSDEGVSDWKHVIDVEKEQKELRRQEKELTEAQ